MEVSKKALIATLIIDLLLIAIGTVCTILLDYSITALGICVAVAVLILISTVMIWYFARASHKAN